MTAASCRARQSSNIRASPVPSGGCGLFDEWPRGITQSSPAAPWSCPALRSSCASPFARRRAQRRTSPRWSPCEHDRRSVGPAVNGAGRGRGVQPRCKRAPERLARSGQRRRQRNGASGAAPPFLRGTASPEQVCTRQRLLGGRSSCPSAAVGCRQRSPALGARMDLSGRRGAPPRDELP